MGISLNIFCHPIWIVHFVCKFLEKKVPNTRNSAKVLIQRKTKWNHSSNKYGERKKLAKEKRNEIKFKYIPQLSRLMDWRQIAMREKVNCHLQQKGNSKHFPEHHHYWPLVPCKTSQRHQNALKLFNLHVTLLHSFDERSKLLKCQYVDSSLSHSNRNKHFSARHCCMCF